MHIKIMHEKVVIPYISYKFSFHSYIPNFALKSYFAQQLNAAKEKRLETLKNKGYSRYNDLGV